MHLRFTLLAVILIVTLNGFPQTGIKSAQQEMSLFNYTTAVEILKKTVADHGATSTCEATLLLADCYRLLNDAENAKIWYSKAIEMAGQCRKAGNQGPVIFIHYAQALRSCGDYRQAKKFFLKYDSLVRGQHHGKIFAAYCDSAIVWKEAKPVFETRNAITLNTPQSEFGTVFFQRGIVFTSDRLSSTDTKNKYGWTGNNYLNQYYAEPAKPDSIPGSFKIPEPFPGLPGRDWHDGPVTFSSDFTEVYMNQTQLNRDKGKKEAGRIRTHLLKIFHTVSTEGKWSLPEPFFLNSDNFSVGHPALAGDGKTLYFVSDMPGGYGETDIWLCRREGNAWGRPVNPGPAVNTAGKEMFPFIASNGDLYFSSDGLPGFGGLDLFVTREINKHWSEPHNLGCPVNSSYDDFSLAISVDNAYGFFSSNRPGGAGDDDIYSFRKSPPPDQKSGEPLVPVALTSSSTEIPSSFPSHPDTLSINKNYLLENIFYDYDKWVIRADARPSLNNLVAVLKEYPVSVELGSHTDCRGSEMYNLQLSQKRAESAVNYIISQGIDPVRITARGYGKSHLINRCNCAQSVRCTEVEHQENRRTEFRITGWNVNPDHNE